MSESAALREGLHSSRMMTEISAANLAEFCYFPMDLFPTGPAASCHGDEWLVSFSLPTKLSTLPKHGESKHGESEHGESEHGESEN